MRKASCFNIKKESFEKLTGCDIDHIVEYVMMGDSWGTFMKISAMIETASKRALAFKLGIEPDCDSVMKISFYKSLVQCKEAGLISFEAYEFANTLREVRNGLAHKGGVLDLSIERLLGTEFFKKYVKQIQEFIVLGDTRITDDTQSHLNTLLMGYVAFVSMLAKSLLDEEWIEDLSDESQL